MGLQCEGDQLTVSQSSYADVDRTVGRCRNKLYLNDSGPKYVQKF